MDISLAPGYTYRAPTEDDIPAILTIMQAITMSILAFTPDDIRNDWSHLNPQTDAWLFLAPDGSGAGYGFETNRGYGQLRVQSFTHPEHRGKGIDAAIIALTEARANAQIDLQPEGARVALYNNIPIDDAAACALRETRGYSLVRMHWFMGIEMVEPPPEPVWPAGITIRTAMLGKDERPTFEVVEDAFQDHWGHTPQRFDEWVSPVTRPDFDPSLCFLALDGEEIAGVALNRIRPSGGWVGALAVRRPWRRHGLGTALLYQSFGEFYRRGVTNVGLDVDAQSLTGATRLYERAGMHPTARIATFARELRPGIDLSVRELRQTEA